MTPLNLNIQRATDDESPAVAALVNAAYSKWIEVIGRKPMPMLADYDALIARQCVYCAREGLVLVGVIVLWPADDSLYIDNIAVASKQQGRGVGDALLAFAEQQASALNLSRMTLLTHEKMLYNQDYYRKHGYTELRRETFPDGRSAVWMEKQL
jgi:ribosomal protein S18 acetylase RimI-like enzyme